MIFERDEFAHTPPDPLPGRWQENFFVIAHSDDGDATLLVHCKRWPTTGLQVARVVVARGNEVVSTRIDEPTPSDLRVGGLELLVDAPFRSTRVRGGFLGHRGYQTLGFIALAAGGTVPVEVDMQLTSVLQPADFGHAFELLTANLSHDRVDGKAVFEHRQEHLEQGGAWEGHITIDGTRTALRGLWVRDHTWGERDEAAMSAVGHGFWTSTVLDEGNLYFNATGMVVGDAIRGVGVVVDRAGQSTTTDVSVTFDPSAGLNSFTNTIVTIGGERPITATGEIRRHLVKYLPGSGPRRFDDNGIARVSASAMAGFGVHEFAGTLTQEQDSVVRAAEAGSG